MQGVAVGVEDPVLERGVGGDPSDGLGEVGILLGMAVSGQLVEHDAVPVGPADPAATRPGIVRRLGGERLGFGEEPMKVVV